MLFMEWAVTIACREERIIMKITIIAVGKVKEKFYCQAIQEFEKRLSRYCKLDIIEVPDEPTPDVSGGSIETQVKDREGRRVLKHIREDAYVCALAIDGEMLDSIQLSKKIEQLGIQGISHLIFVIGGSLGLSREVIARADFQLSFSKMTFPHQLMRVILLEQIYRGYRIMKHEPYHK